MGGVGQVCAIRTLLGYSGDTRVPRVRYTLCGDRGARWEDGEVVCGVKAPTLAGHTGMQSVRCRGCVGIGALGGRERQVCVVETHPHWGGCTQFPPIQLRHVGIGAPNGRAVQLCAVRTPPPCGSYTRGPRVLNGPCGVGGTGSGAGQVYAIRVLLRYSGYTGVPGARRGPCGDTGARWTDGEVVCGLKPPTLRQPHPKTPSLTRDVWG